MHISARNLFLYSSAFVLYTDDHVTFEEANGGPP